ncbi:hypothetical protein O3P69_006093 [Scylla paramamosain]|uniref:Uncharacterized protein n=1 Tax=Scylla paramamosain TaxID=85552 RepID=A0AAW0U8F8_SCYPA
MDERGGCRGNTAQVWVEAEAQVSYIQAAHGGLAPEPLHSVSGVLMAALQNTGRIHPPYKHSLRLICPLSSCSPCSGMLGRSLGNTRRHTRSN